jgi:predicted dehydrogenase
MTSIRLALVGCGGMGTRHLHGLKRLADSGLNNVDLVALCDLRREHLELAAQETETLLGYWPALYENLDALQAGQPDLDAVSVVTDPLTHHALVCQSLAAGWHVMVEKPLGVTVRAGRRMVDAAAAHGRKLAVAENYRRDPVNRLARGVLERGLIGRPYLMVQHAVSGGRNVLITPWRHEKRYGGLLLDVGVHYTDLILYYLGDFATAYGTAEMVEPVRFKRGGPQPYHFHEQQQADLPDEIRPTAEDTSNALFTMTNGATVNWSVAMSGHGGHGNRLVYGPEGRLDQSGGDRSGRPGKLLLSDGQELVGPDILEVVPDFALDEITTRLFGERVVQYELPFSEIDQKINAIENHDFADAILNDRSPEVDGHVGLQAVTAIYAILESAQSGRVVTMEEVLDGTADGYQREIDEELGLV